MTKPQVKDFDLSDEHSRLDAKNEFDGHLVYGSKNFHISTNRSNAKKSGPADGAMHHEQADVIRDNGHDRCERIAQFWEDVNECPICGEKERSFFLTRFGLDIYKCESCTHRYMHPRITFEKLITLYAKDYTATKIYSSEPQLDIDGVKSTYGLNLLDKLGVPDKGRIMDLGCGSGKFLATAHQHGWQDCVGVDANPTFQDIHEAVNGVRFIYSSFENLDTKAIGDGYSAITLWNVLEHLYDLKAIVRQIQTLLKKDGLLFIMVPNVESLATKLIRDKSATFNWKHVAHFSPASLEKLMVDAGFKVELMETSISEIENVKSYLNGAWPYSGYGDPDGLFDWITPSFIHDNMLGSRLIGVFRRTK